MNAQEIHDDGIAGDGSEGPSRLDFLREKIAYSAARSDIECYCKEAGGDRETGWIYDTGKLEHEEWDRECVDEAVEYLDLCGALIHDPENPALVRFKDRI